MLDQFQRTYLAVWFAVKMCIKLAAFVSCDVASLPN